MTFNPIKIAKYWVEGSAQDFRAARSLFDLKHYPQQ